MGMGTGTLHQHGFRGSPGGCNWEVHAMVSKVHGGSLMQLNGSGELGRPKIYREQETDT